MKTLLRFILVALCLNFGSCDVPGTLVGFSRLASRATATCVNKITPVCGDCNTVWKCQNTDTPAAPTVDCKTAYTDRPYCSNGACSSERSADCQTTFRCTGAGYYPDPLNCSKYHLCASTGGAVATYECPIGFVYNPVTTMCKLSALATDCAVIDCSADPFAYVVYPADKMFFASCTPDEDPLMFRCPPYNVFKPSTIECVFQCPRAGRIAHPSSVTKYYECYLSGTTYYYRESTCVDGFQFDQQSEQYTITALNHNVITKTGKIWCQFSGHFRAIEYYPYRRIYELTATKLSGKNLIVMDFFKLMVDNYLRCI